MSNQGDAHNDILMSLSDEAVCPMEAPETADAPSQWLTVTEAAARLGVSEKTLRKRINSGKIEAHKVTLPAGGVAWRVAADALNGAVGPLPRLEEVGSATEGVGLPASERNGSATEVQRTVREREGRAPVGSATHREGIEKERTDPALVGRVDALSNEVEQLKAFIAGGAMQAINERLAQLPDAEATREMMAQAVKTALQEALQTDEQQPETISKDDLAQAVKDGISEALQADSQQRAEMVTKDDLAAAVEQGIAAAVKDSDAEEREATAKAVSEAQAPVVEGIAKVLERLTWLEEDNANLRKEIDERDKKRGLFGWLRK